MAVNDSVSSVTIDQLEHRLRVITFAVSGNLGDGTAWVDAQNSTNAAARIRALDRQLQTLSSRSQPVADVLALHGKKPDVFNAAKTSPASLSTPSLAQLIVSHARLLQWISAQLTSLQNQSIPDVSLLTKIIALHQRILHLKERQDKYYRELSNLKGRSAEALASWHEQGIIEMSEHWADWEERLRDVEILVRRMEAAKKREGGVV